MIGDDDTMTNKSVYSKSTKCVSTQAEVLSINCREFFRAIK